MYELLVSATCVHLEQGICVSFVEHLSKNFSWLVLLVMLRGVERHNIFVQTCSVFEMFSFSKNPIALLLSINHVPNLGFAKQIINGEVES